MKYIKRLGAFSFPLFVGVFACSTHYYVPPTSGPTATVSFSNLSPEYPMVSIVDSCLATQVKDTYIETKKPNDVARRNLTVTAEKEVTFSYRYHGIQSETMELGGSTFLGVQSQTVKQLGVCEEAVTVYIEAGKRYDVFFNITSNQCSIGVAEIVKKKSALKQVVKRMNSLPSPSC